MNSGAGKIVLGYWVPGVLLIMLAFWAGSQKDATLGLLGFVPFFMAGMFLFIHGYKKIFGPVQDDKDDDERKGA